jgi:antitoxin (DNA-binding transcriptional repressor) of toxin-antitoxin stability system
MSNAEERVSLRQLHSRTGHYVRQAARHRIVVTDNGKAIAEIKPLSEDDNEVPYFARRKLTPEFKKLMESGGLKPKPGSRDITDLISEDRDRW